MSVKKCDVVLMGKNAAGEQTVNMPLTRLGNIEDDAEIKEKPAAGDYIPIMDMEDGGQMKKFPYTSLESSGSTAPHYIEKTVTLTGSKGTSDYLTMVINIFAEISEMEISGKTHRVAKGRIRLDSFTVPGGYPTKAFDTLTSSDKGEQKTKTIIPLKIGTTGIGMLEFTFSNLTDTDDPVKVGTCEIRTTESKISTMVLKGQTFPLWIESEI